MSDHRIQVSRLRVVAGTDGPQTAELTLSVDGVERASEATGDGPVDAVFNAIKQAFSHTAELRLFQVHAVTEGTDAQAEVSVKLEDVAAGKSVTARAADPDTLVASAKAYLAALNKLEIKRARTKPEPMAELARGERRGP